MPLRPTHGGRAEMLEPARAPAILTPVGLLIRLKRRGTGFSERERSARQQDDLNGLYNMVISLLPNYIVE